MIWLVGNNGMLGKELSNALKNANLLFVGTDREIDITNLAALLNFATNQEQPFLWIINCAAYTAVDKAEDDIDNCRLLNTDGAENIACIAFKIGARLIHISTDYVFNGQENRPYKEEDPTDPIGIYGLTKRDGEIKILQKNEKSYIIRTAWLYGKYGNNFVHTMLRLMNERESLSVVNDQKGSPTWTRDLACVIITLLNSVDSRIIPFGIYHFTNEGEITWYDFAVEIYKQARALNILTKNCEVNPCTSADFPAKVKRPAYSVLDTSKIKAFLKRIPLWDESLRGFLSEYA